MLPQPSQSLDSTELQLREVLDGADHLGGVAVLVRRAFGPLLNPFKSSKIKAFSDCL